MKEPHPSYKELFDYAKWCQTFQPRALEVIKTNDFKFEADLSKNYKKDRWEKLAFTFYTYLVEIHSKAEHGLFNED